MTEEEEKIVKSSTVDKCQVKEITCSLFQCLLQEQAVYCGNSIAFGSIYFCKHDHRKEFIVIPKKIHFIKK